MNTKFLLIFVLVFSLQIVYAQVGIGTTDPKSSLDITASNASNPSNTDGLLIPKIDNYPSTNPGADQDGMMVFVTGNGAPIKGFYYWDNGTSTWVSVVGVDTKNTLDGAYDEGGAGAGRFITTDNGPVQIDGNGGLRVDAQNNTHMLFVNSSQNEIGINTPNPSAMLDIVSTGVGSVTVPVVELTTTNAEDGMHIRLSGSIDGTAENLDGVYVSDNSAGNANGTRTKGFTAYMNGSSTTTSHEARSFESVITNSSSYIGNTYGYYHLNLSTSNGNQYGTLNAIGNSGNGSHYGMYSTLTGSGSGNKYGIFSSINPTAGGTHYGIYSNATSATGYAGYFIGRTSFGTSFTSRYLMPDSDGTSGQIITTDGLGQLSFVDSNTLFTDTDNQNLTVATLTGTTLNLGIQNGTGTSVNLSSLQDGNTQNTLDQAYDEGGSGSGKNITADNGAVRINGTDGFLVTGTFGSGNSIDSEITGNGVRMFFYPAKGAFRAGWADGNQWDDINIGDYSFAGGNRSLASGTYSTVFGQDNVATGIGSFATGINGGSQGDYSASFGLYNYANGAGSFSFGSYNEANGDYSFAGGTASRANGNYSFANGNSITNGDYAFSSGHGLTAASYGETVFGLFSSNYAANSITTFNSSDRLFTIGNGLDFSNRSNALTIYKNGRMNINDVYNMPIADGTNGQVMTTDGAGNVSFQNIVGDGTGTDNQNLAPATLTGTTLNLGIQNGTGTSVDLTSLQDGDTQNTLDQAYDEGGIGNGRTINATDGALRINGDDGFLVTGTAGSGNTIDSEITGAGTRMFFNPRKGAFRTGRVDANQWDDANIGFYSFAVGENTIASSSWDIAMGLGTTASGGGSIALGIDTVASGLLATAIGDQNIASGDRSLALGQISLASGTSSTAMGSLTVASGDNSFALGTSITSASFSETSIGVFNTNYTPNNTTAFNVSDRLFVVGNGTSNGNRSNALTIFKSGLMNINDAYNMPLADGSTGQVMTTDGAGNVTFQTPAIGVQRINDLLDGKSDNDGSDNWSSIYLGFNSGATDNETDNRNVGIGYESLNAAGNSYNNTALGYQTLANNGAGYYNTAVGYQSLLDNIFGNYNTSLGSNAMVSNTSGNHNVAIGYRAMNSSRSGDSNVAIGSAAGFDINTQSHNNVFIGFNAGRGPALHNKSGSVMIGFEAGRLETNSNRLYIENSDSNLPLLYGEFDNDILRINGELQVGNPTASGYVFPAADGLNGQVMTTDGSGNVTFQNPNTGTDNQQIDTFSFNTSTNELTLEIEDDGQPAQVVDLSSLNPQKAIARLFMSASQTETGSGLSKVNFDSAEFDLGNNFNTTTDEFIVPQTGIYRVTTQITMDASTGLGVFDVRIRINGTQQRRAEYNHTGSGQIVRQITSILSLTAGDTIDIAFSRPTIGATIQANSRASFFEIEQL